MYQKSYWEQESFFAPHDFVIVGSGFAGLWAAFELKRKYPDADVLILERGVVPMGASTRNAGFACFGSPTEMMSDIEKMGEDAMWQTVEMRYRGLEKIRKIFGDSVINFDPVGGYECLQAGKHDFEYIEDALTDLNKGLQSITGVSETFTWRNEGLAEKGLTGFDGLIENSLEGGLHSGKLAMALMRKVTESGVTIITASEITGWKRVGDSIEVVTPQFSITANTLIVAANAFSNSICADTRVVPARGQILVTVPIENLKLKGTFHFDEGYYYFRNVENRVLLGGARNKALDQEETVDMVTSEVIQIELERFLYEHILSGTKVKIEYRWSGVMAFTHDKKPTIQEVEKNVFSLVSCNGMGVALTPIMAEQLVKAIN